MLHDPTIGIMCSIITIFIAALQGKIYSHKEIQDYNSTSCGWFCIAAIVSDDNSKTHFNKFLNIFSSISPHLFERLKTKRI